MIPFLLTLASVTIPAVLAALAGYHLGRANGVVRVVAPPTIRPTSKVVLYPAPTAPDADLLAEAEARGYAAGAHDERARHRAARSAAGTKAAATRRNRVTGEARPAALTPDAEGAE